MGNINTKTEGNISKDTVISSNTKNVDNSTVNFNSGIKGSNTKDIPSSNSSTLGSENVTSINNDLINKCTDESVNLTILDNNINDLFIKNDLFEMVQINHNIYIIFALFSFMLIIAIYLIFKLLFINKD
jgi:hypothetical protein